MKKNNFLYMLTFLKLYIIPYSIGLLIISSYYLITDTFTGKIYSIIISTDTLPNLFEKLMELLIYIGIIMLLFSIGMAIFNYSIAYANKNIRYSIIHVFEYMSIEEYSKKHSGDWLTIFNKDVDQAINVYRQQARQVLSAIISSVGGLYILSTKNTIFTLFTIIIGLSCMILGISRIRIMKRISVLLRKEVQSISIQISNVIQGANEINFYQMGNLVKKWFKKSISTLTAHNLKLAHTQMWVGALSQLGTAFCYSISLIFGLYLVSIKNMSLSLMMECWPISLGVALGFQEFGFFSTSFQPISVSISSIRELLSTPLERGGKLQKIDTSKLPISFQNVSFCYGDQEILSNLNFEIHTGEKIAIVGKSGSGKSTIIKLLLRMYDIKNGSIKVFGHDITDYELHYLRSLFSYVPQDCPILSGSIYENIQLGTYKSEKYNIIKAATDANANEFIEKLPDGYQTIIGKNELQLSGGEKQRLAIARAFFRNSPIFLLDEASSALDNLNERKLIDILSKSKQTMIIITHRPALLEIVDKVITLENGHVILSE